MQLNGLSASQSETEPGFNRRVETPQTPARDRQHVAETVCLGQGVEQREGTRELIGFNTVALDVISIIRPPIRASPYFSWGSGKSAPPSESAEKKRERELFEDISTRYTPGRRAWVRPDLVPLSIGRLGGPLPSRLPQTLDPLRLGTKEGFGDTIVDLPRLFVV